MGSLTSLSLSCMINKSPFRSPYGLAYEFVIKSPALQVVCKAGDLELCSNRTIAALLKRRWQFLAPHGWER